MMFRIFLRVSLLITLLAHLQVVQAYGNLGHTVIAQLAESYLSDASKQAITELAPNEDLADIAWWADKMRNTNNSSPFWNYTHSANWHFVNIPPEQLYDPGKSSEEGNIIQAIAAFTDILLDQPPTSGPIYEGLVQYKEEFPDLPDPFTDKLLALKFLVHFIADMHQPLHMGHGVDRGGNDIAVEWFGRSTNLHAVWDTQLIRAIEPSSEALFRRLNEDIQWVTEEQYKSVAETSVQQWLDEGLKLRVLVYNSAKAGNKLRIKYSTAYGVYARTQLLKAAIRTAETLNQIFDSH